MAKRPTKSQARSAGEPQAEGDQPRVYFIPARISGVPITHLPLSSALYSVLARMRVAKLGDLHGVAVETLRRTAREGAELVTELAGLLARASQGAGAKAGQRQPAPSARPKPNEAVLLPQASHDIELKGLSLPAALGRFVQAQDFRVLGDLHGATLGELAKVAGWNDRVERELLRLVQGNKGEVRYCPPVTLAGSRIDLPPTGSGAHRSRRSADAAPPAPFKLPRAAWGVRISELPLSTRLEAAFADRSVVQLGDLEGRSMADFRFLRNCGKRTLAELNRLVDRAGAGEFTVSPAALRSLQPADVVPLLDGLVGDLPARARTMLVWRLGGADEKCWTLQAIGSHFGLTRERVRQVVESLAPTLRRHGGIRLSHLLQRIARDCEQTVCPLTPMLVAQWLSQRRARSRFSHCFYAGLLGELDSKLPAWPSVGPVFRVLDARTKSLIDSLVELLTAETRALPLKRAFERVRTAGPGAGTSALEFLEALRGSKRFRLDWSDPAQPRVLLAKTAHQAGR